MRALGNLRRQQSRYAEARPLLSRALAVSERRLGRRHLETALTLNALGVLCKYTHPSMCLLFISPIDVQSKSYVDLMLEKAEGYLAEICEALNYVVDWLG